jgi:uracil phosphoribosyltransferase
MIDVAYTRSRYAAPELEHRYGSNVHLLDDPLAWSLLTRACSPSTTQPEFGRLVRILYEGLTRVVLAAELPRERVDAPTRMFSAHPEAVYRGLAIARRTKVVTVAIARAGTNPSQVLFELLNEVLDPAYVRQDHLFMSRKLNEAGQVIGTEWHDAKIGRDIDGCTVMFPDPMGATGSSLVSAVHHYDRAVEGSPAKYIAMHLMVTPEDLRRLARDRPEVVVYALRLDRALSSEQALRSTPGEHWDEERGLNDQQYIVPGAGGVGELLNNAWV